MTGPVMAITRDGSRVHMQHGPIDLIVEAWGDAAGVTEAYRRAWERFQPLLDELVAELPALRRPVGRASAALSGAALSGAVARRMAAAVRPFADGVVTPMAAVAGAVADEILETMVTAGGLRRAYVNDGGDIALHLAPGESLEVGLVPLPHRAALAARATIRWEDPVRGVATSGRHGRSFSLGIADAVTVLAASSARADAAATLIANAVDLPGHRAIERVPACDLAPDSDLGDRPVTVGVGTLTPGEVSRALGAGVEEAGRMRGEGSIEAAVVFLQGRVAMVATPVLASAAGG
ncbi:MAG TPA: UPF0280 family protein [Actinomycetota bacterium]|nr:UPF0280 family protein [Actinomycetota bacterium]